MRLHMAIAHAEASTHPNWPKHDTPVHLGNRSALGLMQIVRTAVRSSWIGDGGHDPFARWPEMSAMSAMSEANESRRELSMFKRINWADKSTFDFDTMSLTFLDLVLEMKGVNWRMTFGNPKLFGKFGGVGAFAMLRIANYVHTPRLGLLLAASCLVPCSESHSTGHALLAML